MSEAIDASNLAVVRGTLSGPPRRRQLPSGTVLAELDVTTRGEAGSLSVPVCWFDPDAVIDRVGAGDAVVVVGSVRRRFFRNAGGTQSRTEVVARQVVPAGRARRIERLLAGCAAALSSPAD